MYAPVAGLVGDLTAIGRRYASADPAVETLADRADGTLVRVGEVVVKAHPAGDEVVRKLAVAAEPSVGHLLLRPIAVTRLGDRVVSVWPYGVPVHPDHPEAAPWADAGRLLAGLHAIPLDRLGTPPGPMGQPAKLARAMGRLAATGVGPAVAVVRRAYDGLASGGPRQPDRLVHGDLHLGQLVRLPAGEWRLIDVDDLGTGDPAFDLSRPAAWYATGLLDPIAWEQFLTAYREAGGVAVPPVGDVWPALEFPARMMVVQLAALAVAAAGKAGRAVDEIESVVVDACARMSD